jgi:hypothetical protein
MGVSEATVPALTLTEIQLAEQRVCFYQLGQSNEYEQNPDGCRRYRRNTGCI